MILVACHSAVLSVSAQAASPFSSNPHPHIAAHIPLYLYPFLST